MSGARISAIDIHFHAVDDGDEILAPQIERAHRLRQAQKTLRRRAGIHRIDIGAPNAATAEPRLARGPGSSAMSSTARQNE